jgi:hypothetical protein
VVTVDIVRWIYNRQKEIWDTELGELLTNPGKSKLLVKRLLEAGYAAVPNPDEKSGRWRVEGTKKIIFARQELTDEEALDAARKLAKMGTSAAMEYLQEVFDKRGNG